MASQQGHGGIFRGRLSVISRGYCYIFLQLRKVWLFPFLYAFSMLAVCCVIAVLYRLQKRLGRKKSIDIVGEYDAALPKLQKIQQKAAQKEAEARMSSVAVVGSPHFNENYRF